MFTSRAQEIPSHDVDCIRHKFHTYNKGGPSRTWRPQTKTKTNQTKLKNARENVGPARETGPGAAASGKTLGYCLYIAVNSVSSISHIFQYIPTILSLEPSYPLYFPYKPLDI